jgi:methyl-accepting chemotaxis protein
MASFLIVAAMAAVIGFIGITKIRTVAKSGEELYAVNTIPILQLGEISTAYNRIRINLRDLLLDDNKANQAHYVDTIKELRKEIDETMPKYEKLIHTKEVQEQWATFKDTFAKFVVIEENILRLELEGKMEEARHIMNKECGPAAKVINGSVAKMEEALTAEAKEKNDKNAATAKSAIVMSVIVVAIGVLLAIGLGIFISRSINNPLKKSVDFAKGVADGDLSQRIDLNRKDEIGDLTTALNGMVNNLTKVIENVKQAANNVASASTQLYSTAEQLATGSEEVASQASTVATSAEEMAATSTEIARNSGMAAEGSKHANDSATTGASVVKATVDGMNRIAERVKDTAKTVESLGSRSDQIGEIVGTIEDIADQTNLLALNAAIEAARAGEQGRGFAVVADEVRALAERTTKATKEIAQMIKAIQHETKGAVSSMEEGVKEVGKGTEEAAKSGQALQDILNQINSVTAQVNQIASSAEQQTSTTTAISNNINQITNVVTEAAKGAQESARAAATLSTLADEVLKIVGQFKLAA